MTVVPLPRRSADMCSRFAVVADPQLIPGNTFGDIWKEAHGEVGVNALVLQNPAVAGTLFNLLLLLPLGSSCAITSGKGCGPPRPSASAPRCSSS
ncbi:hypothetical protein SAZ11_33485 [Streptomyces sp. FXJ1.4098]|nr:hypothetical protein [Streptomyces sp. FXJ1.4098]